MVEIINAAAIDGLFTKIVKGKLKLLEKAKPGKYPRIIGDFTCPGSLLAGFLCELIKKSFGVLRCPGFAAHYVSSTEPDILDYVGETLYNSQENISFYFSDDCLSKFGGELIESDISSCDISNGPAVFDCAKFVCQDFPQFYSVISRAVDQCKNNFVLSQPERKTNKISFVPKRPIEFSGTTLTTLLNNFASLIISLKTHLDGSKTGKYDISGSAYATGYIVTNSVKSCLEECQFLKHSWDTSLGTPKSFLNLGCILRSFGTCRGDLPGSGEILKRAFIWNSSLMDAYIHCGENTITAALRRVYNSKKHYRLPGDITKHGSLGKRGQISDQALTKRYSCSIVELEELATHISRPFGIHNSPLIRRIYHTDYGA
jgi:hypothetical protein